VGRDPDPCCRLELSAVPRSWSFDAPARLWVLAAVVVLGAVALVAARHRRRTAEPYADAALAASVAPHRLGWRRVAASAGLALAVVSLTTAFAKPSVLAHDAKDRAVVVVALDTSSSMMATDVSPDRFTAAKVAAQAFIRDLPAQIDVGLVAYNATATLVAAPTERHEQVADAVDGLTMSGGTAAGDALEVSLSAVLTELRAASAADRPAARIVLLSDGDSTVGTPIEQAVATVAAAGVPVSTIGYGTQDGVVVANGVTYHVPLNLAQLQSVAEATGGTAYDAATADELRAVYDDIGTALVAETAREDVSDVLAGAGLLLLIGTAVPSLAWSSRLV
jgi:Ca-activated chloride channel family protein